MSNKKKIVLSLTGIILVLLILLGLTYAYFLTSVQGNTNIKSIDVDTSELALTYGDNDPNIITANSVRPGNIIGSKTFTVTNNGDDNDYIVIVDGVSITDASTTETTTFESNDFVYTITCVSSDNVSCNSVTEESTLPLINNGLLVSNRIRSGATQTYNLTVTYKETGVDQSNDMNKALALRINIGNIRNINPYSNNTSLLSYNIINNSLLEKNGTVLRNAPITQPAEAVSAETEKVLTIAKDDYFYTTNNLSYYFRGSVIDNYVDFGGYCWRIVRIEGDGSVKLVLASVNGVCETSANLTNNSAFIGSGDYGYDTNNLADYENGESRTTSQSYRIDAFLNGGSFEENNETVEYTTFSELNLAKIKTNNICISNLTNKYNNDGTAYTTGTSWYYNAYKRLAISTMYNPDLTCKGTNISKKIAPLTADEIVFAGAKYGTANTNYYLNQNASQYLHLILIQLMIMLLLLVQMVV